MFIHLRVKSDYSLLQSTLKTHRIVDLALKHKMPAVVLADSDNLSGALEFATYAAENGIQPIIGCDLTLYNSFNSCLSKILLIAYNQEGFKNLINLSSIASIKNNTFDDLEKYSFGLIALSGDVLVDSIICGHKIIETVSVLQHIFVDNFFIEIQRGCRTVENKKIERMLLKIALGHDIPIVATNTILFEDKSFFEAYEVMCCISSGEYISNKKEIFSKECYFKSKYKMTDIFSDIRVAISNTILIAKKCHFMPESIEPALPSFEAGDEVVTTPELESLESLSQTNEESKILINYAYSGLKMRLQTSSIPEAYIKRMIYELKIIINMNYAGYFLIVSDFIKWSKANNIPVGPGRGSAVGSLVSWSLYITELDPIHYGLLFERFLNPDRISMPDIDIDFCQEKRDLVIGYIHKKYQNVAHIITFGTLQPRAVLKDVGRVLQIPYSKVDNICKLIPMNPTNPITLDEAIRLDHNLQNERDADETIKKLLDIALKLEGLYRHGSTHAAGIVISNQDLKNLVPIYYDSNTKMAVTQYPMKYVEKAGLIKFDFLGLKTLTIIHKAIELIAECTIKIEDIPLDDKKVFEMLSKGNSVGIFQLESHFMQETLPKLRPDNINDIIALISLNRPGPMDNIPSYIARKHGNEKVSYPHMLLQDVLKETFGVIIYQEQVMESARILANYSLSEADLLRRAMGKKIKQEMEVQKDAFINGAKKNNITTEQAGKIFETLEKFAGYGFNKSHAAAYAVISYQTAYLKANFPLEFFTAVMNLEINNTDKLAIFVEDAKKNGIEIVSPSVQNPSVYFTILDGKIHYGISAIKGVGIIAAEVIASSTCRDIWDFAKYISNSSINKKSIENLIKAGFFDVLVANRKQLILSIEKILKYKVNALQQSLFDSEPELDDVEDFDPITKIENEFEAFGLYLSNHPISFYQKLLNVCSDSGMKNLLFGVIAFLRIRSTNRGKFAVVELSTPIGTQTIYFYDSVIIESNSNLFTEKNKVVISYEINNSRMIGKNIYNLEEYIKKSLKNNLTIELSGKTTEFTIDKLKNSLEEGGKIALILKINYENDHIKILLPNKYFIKLTEFLSIKEICDVYIT